MSANQIKSLKARVSKLSPKSLDKIDSGPLGTVLETLFAAGKAVLNNKEITRLEKKISMLEKGEAAAERRTSTKKYMEGDDSSEYHGKEAKQIKKAKKVKSTKGFSKGGLVDYRKTGLFK